MIIKEIHPDSHSVWLGMEDYKLILDQNKIEIDLKYDGEPPHGDSYHIAWIDGKRLKGYIWGCMFLFPFNQRYMLCSWMEKLYERKTIVVDLNSNFFAVLDDYWYDFKEVDGKLLLGNNNFKEIKILDISEIKDWVEL